MSTKTSKWTENLITQLKDLYINKNLTTVEIAKQLGFTKNAIIGKIHRLQLQKNDPNNLLKGSSSGVNEDNSDIPSFIRPFNPVSGKHEFGQYNLEEIESAMCIWPSGDGKFTFCGKPALQGKSYCAEHYDLVYLTVKRVSKHSAENIYTEDDIVDEDVETIEELDDDNN